MIISARSGCLQIAERQGSESSIQQKIRSSTYYQLESNSQFRNTWDAHTRKAPSQSHAATAWGYWQEYVRECKCSLWQDPDTDEAVLCLSGFKAALAENLYGSSIKAASTVTTYYQQVLWILNKNKATAINRAVNRGIGKSLADGKKYQGSLDLSFYATLYSMVLDSSTKVLNLKLVRNLLVYSFLGFAIQRAQSATVNTITKLKNPERVLLRRNVVIDRDRYCIWWALTHSKGDPFGRRKGKDRLDWTVTAGSRAGGKHQHPIDIVALYLIYCQMMGY
jgi:hypothetical protein